MTKAHNRNLWAKQAVCHLSSGRLLASAWVAAGFPCRNPGRCCRLGCFQEGALVHPDTACSLLLIRWDPWEPLLQPHPAMCLCQTPWENQGGGWGWSPAELRRRGARAVRICAPLWICTHIPTSHKCDSVFCSPARGRAVPPVWVSTTLLAAKESTSLFFHQCGTTSGHSGDLY